MLLFYIKTLWIILLKIKPKGKRIHFRNLIRAIWNKNWNKNYNNISVKFFTSFERAITNELIKEYRSNKIYKKILSIGLKHLEL